MSILFELLSNILCYLFLTPYYKFEVLSELGVGH